MQWIHHNARRLLLGAILTGLILVAVPASAQASNALPQCHVLSIGVENYPTQVKLPGCAKDAHYLAERFGQQEGKLFSKVTKRILVNDQATQQAILAAMNQLRQQGQAGDWIVLIASGHNCGKGSNWGFMARDEKQISGHAILDLADGMARQGKKVLIVIDACYSGQFRLMAQNTLIRHADPSKGGIVLMLASMPNQPSVVLTNRFSVFSKAIDEGLAGKADYNGDGTVTLQELRRYTYNRVHQLLNYGPNSQNASIDYSLSISENVALARVQPAILNVQGNLTKQDAKDRVRNQSFCKVYEVTLTQGVAYTIDMRSTELDSYLRLEDATGKELRRDDDSGGDLNARIVFTPTQTGTYRIVATTYKGGATGGFAVTVK